MKITCKRCEKEFDREDVLLIKKSIVLRGTMGEQPMELEYALCKPCYATLKKEQDEEIFGKGTK